MSVVVNVMLSLISVMSPPPALCNISVKWCCEVMYFGCFSNRGKQFELLEFVSESVYVDLQYEISLTFTDGSVCLCGVSSSVVVLGLFVRLS